jgi:transposase
MGAALTIRDDLTPEALRRHARREPNRRAALRMLAIANALEGMSRAEAARLAGPRTAAAARCCADGASALPMLERQALRDAVVRYNAEGLAGLHDRPKPGRPARLSEAEQAALAARVFRGPDPERDGVAAWTRADLCGWLEARFGKPFHPSSLSRVLSRLDLSRQKTRPAHPEADPGAQERFRKRGCATP